MTPIDELFWVFLRRLERLIVQQLVPQIWRLAVAVKLDDEAIKHILK